MNPRDVVGRMKSAPPAPATDSHTASVKSPPTFKSEQKTFPLESVVNLPPPVKVEQLNSLTWRDPPASSSPPLNVEDAVESVTVNGPASVVEPVALMAAIVVLAMSAISSTLTFPAVILSVEEVPVQMESWLAGELVPMATLSKVASTKRGPIVVEAVMVEDAFTINPMVVVG